MNSTPKITLDQVNHLVKLAHIHLSGPALLKLHPQLSGILDYMSKIQAAKTEGVSETTQVTGLVNVTREDIIDSSRILTQSDVLRNAVKQHRGFFVVDAVLKG